MRKTMTKIASLLLGLSLVLNACGPAATEVPPTPTLTPYPIVDCQAGKTCVRWFVGLGTGSDPAQITVQEEVVNDYNTSQDAIQLILEVVPHDGGRDILSTQIASGDGPDIVGPVGWAGSNDFYGQWLDIGPYIQSSGFDTSIFDPALLDAYQSEGEGQVGLPFAVFPGGMFFVPAMFDEAGLAYPPQKYGDQYELDSKMVDWNWDTVTEVAKRLTIDVNGVNAKQKDFNPTQIAQVGYNAQWQSFQSVGTFYGGSDLVYTCNQSHAYKAAISEGWKEAWQWYYNGMWGEQPFMANGPLAGSPEFGGGNVFNSSKAAMALTQTWYTCCLADLAKTTEFQIGIMPMMANGEVSGRMDADTFRIWKGTKNPEAAFDVLAYLVTDGADKLLPTYGAMPAVPEKTEAFFKAKSEQYPLVTKESWDVFVQGLAYPDGPSAESWMPSPIEGGARINTFKNLLETIPPNQFDFEAEYQKLSDDLTVIFNKGNPSCQRSSRDILRDLVTSTGIISLGQIDLRSAGVWPLGSGDAYQFLGAVTKARKSTNIIGILSIASNAENPTYSPGLYLIQLSDPDKPYIALIDMNGKESPALDVEWENPKDLGIQEGESIFLVGEENVPIALHLAKLTRADPWVGEGIFQTAPRRCDWCFPWWDWENKRWITKCVCVTC